MLSKRVACVQQRPFTLSIVRFPAKASEHEQFVQFVICKLAVTKVVFGINGPGPNTKPNPWCTVASNFPILQADLHPKTKLMNRISTPILRCSANPEPKKASYPSHFSGINTMVLRGIAKEQANLSSFSLSHSIRVLSTHQLRQLAAPYCSKPETSRSRSPAA